MTDLAYLIEVTSPGSAPRLFAVRDTLDDAQTVGGSIAPNVAVVIREFTMPTEATLGRSELRVWDRGATGTWVERARS